MNKLFFYTATAIILLTATSRNAFCQAVMTMTVDLKRNFKGNILTRIGLAGSDSVSIDWGNGINDNFILSFNDTIYCDIVYPDTFTRTITIIGKDVRFLHCERNLLTNLDVSKNIALEHLNCGWNQLTDLDVSKNIALCYLNCEWNLLTSLDVSQNTALTELLCNANRLSSLSICKNITLKYLDCSGNQLTNLNVSKNTEIFYIECSTNTFSEMALNALFGTLCNRKGTIVIYKNPGTDACNKNIAKKKKWKVIDKKN